MSRLDSFIRRLEAQRSCLDHAVRLLDDLPGVVFELGFGHGRTYDHLRARCPAREIFVFDRRIRVESDLAPDAAHRFVGDIRETLPAAAKRFAGAVALVHADIGTGDAAANARIAAFVAGHLPRLLRRGGLVVADQPLHFPGGAPLPLPSDVTPGRYFMLRAA